MRPPRRRPPPRAALRSRYAQGWSVRQPRSLAAERPTPLHAPPSPWPTGGVGGPEADMLAGMPIASTAQPGRTFDAAQPEDASQVDEVFAAGQPTGGAAGLSTTRLRNPETLLADYDNALACARDQEVFTEIDEEFEPRLDALSREHRARAHRTRQRHAARITALAQSGRDGAAP